MWLSQLPENERLQTQHAVYCGRCGLIGATMLGVDSNTTPSAYCPSCGYVGTPGDDRRYK